MVWQHFYLVNVTIEDTVTRTRLCEYRSLSTIEVFGESCIFIRRAASFDRLLNKSFDSTRESSHGHHRRSRVHRDMTLDHIFYICKNNDGEGRAML